MRFLVLLFPSFVLGLAIGIQKHFQSLPLLVTQSTYTLLALILPFRLQARG